mgnify:CR=1 FL=1
MSLQEVAFLVRVTPEAQGHSVDVLPGVVFCGAGGSERGRGALHVSHIS